MTTTIIKTVGNGGSANGYDYGDFNAFSSAVPANLVTADEQWIAEVYATHGELVFTSSQAITGKTTDATRNIIVRAASGQGFADHANKLTNALRYNASNGAALKMTTHSWGTAFDFKSVSRTEGLQFLYTGPGPEDVLDVDSNTVFGCIVDSAINGYQYGIVRALRFINSIAVARSRSGYSEYILRDSYGGSNARISGSVLIALGGTYTGIGQENGGGLGYSSAIFGCATAFSNLGTSGSYTFSNCATNLAALSGTGNLTSLTGSDQFENTTSGALDLRAKSSGSLDAAGVRDQIYTNDIDILAQARSTSTPTIGAFEYGAGGGEATTTVNCTTTTPAFSGSAQVSPVTSITVTTASPTFSGGASTGSAEATITATPESPAFSGSATGDTSQGTLTLPVLKNNTGTVLANETGATVHVYAVSTGNKVVTKTAQTTNGSGVMVITDPLIVAATQYRVVVVLGSGAEGLDKVTAA